jgi:hypothetical protein
LDSNPNQLSIVLSKGILAKLPLCLFKEIVDNLTLKYFLTDIYPFS